MFPDSNRVFALPAIGGLGAPRWDYLTQTAFFGMNTQTRAADLVRGVAEGVAFLVADIVAALRGSGLRPGTVRASGGLARLGYLMQFQADLLGVDIERCGEAEVTALGVASLAAQCAGAPWAAHLRRADVARAEAGDRPGVHGRRRGDGGKNGDEKEQSGGLHRFSSFGAWILTGNAKTSGPKATLASALS